MNPLLFPKVKHRHGLGPDVEALATEQLQLGEGWILVGSGIDSQSREVQRQGVKVTETEKVAYIELEVSVEAGNHLVDTAKCPTCGSDMRRNGLRASRNWMHLPIFGKRTEIRAQLIRLRCLGKDCGKSATLQAPWESPSKHFTIAQEEALIRAIHGGGYSYASRIFGIANSSLLKMLTQRIDKLVEVADWSAVTAIGVDDYAIDEGQEYVSIFSDIKNGRVLFIARGRTHETFKAFLVACAKHGLKLETIKFISMDMGKGYIKGANENFPKAVKIFDKFHVIKLAGDKVDQIRRAEYKASDFKIRTLLSGNRFIYLKNPENLTDKEKERFQRIDMSTFWTGRAYQIRCALQDIYQMPDKGLAGYRFKCLIKWIRRLCKKAPHYFASAMTTFANTLETHRDGILAYWDGDLTNAFHEGLHSVFSGVKRKSRGLSFDGMRTQLYLHFGKLDFGFNIKTKIHSQPLPVWIPKLINSRKSKATPQPQAKEAV